ncbi:hypothetical protein [Nonomuraea typhae]|uniref:hypothetical protein n=1 Tax=Nonomuraea typhae TaxID=2603600 RepID=UPI0012FBA7B5|nr:hypothetical protein [Nonomuraea typhae]
MSRYLVGPGGLRVEPVELGDPDSNLLLARMWDAGAQPGEVWYRVTRNGMALGVPGIYPMDVLQELLDLTELREPDESVGEETA